MEIHIYVGTTTHTLTHKYTRTLTQGAKKTIQQHAKNWTDDTAAWVSVVIAVVLALITFAASPWMRKKIGKSYTYIDIYIHTQMRASLSFSSLFYLLPSCLSPPHSHTHSHKIIHTHTHTDETEARKKERLAQLAVEAEEAQTEDKDTPTHGERAGVPRLVEQVLKNQAAAGQEDDDEHTAGDDNSPLHGHTYTHTHTHTHIQLKKGVNVGPGPLGVGMGEKKPTVMKKMKSALMHGVNVDIHEIIETDATVNQIHKYVCVVFVCMRVCVWDLCEGSV